jgi:hypothetical protein
MFKFIKKIIPKRVKKLIAPFGWDRTVRNLFLFSYFPQFITKYNYSHIIKKLRTQEKINVVFLVRENQRWNSTSLYSKLSSEQRFFPKVLIIISENDYSERYKDYLFFKQRNYNVDIISNLDDFIAHKPDIVFYQQPWFALEIKGFSPYVLSKYSLCLYFPYGIATTIENPWIWNSCKYFFKLIYRQFLFNSDCVKQYKSRGFYNTVATGNPMLDVYVEPVKHNPWRDSSKMKIIYAPHHAFISEKRLGFATFEWNGKQILYMAKHNLHTEWIFKPHPSFRKKVIKAGIMTENEVADYYNEWEKIGQVFDIGDYFDIFKTSDLMITDCDGFLTEYLPTGNPVILLSTKSVRSLVSNKSSRHYYKVFNMTELLSTFEMLVNQRIDPLKEERRKDSMEITLNSAENIYNEIINILRKK